MHRHSNPLLSLGLILILLASGQLGPSRLSSAALPSLQNRDGLPSFAPILREATPAVVNVSVTSTAPETMSPLFRDPFFRRFFEMPEQSVRPRMSAGSGVIVDAREGLVLTNAHVVAGAGQISVRLKDRREFPAKLLGRDPGTDIALLRIQADRLTALGFGDSDRLEVGDIAFAIGNPFGLGQTVTSGIISALGRSGLNMEGFEDFIQTDASINPGNSGGALINARGELIGINTAIIGPSGGNVGIGFAVPSNMARAVMEQMIAHGEVRRGRLGVVIQDLTPDLAEALGAKGARGAVITRVVPGSPADKSGIREGDLVVAVDGEQLEDSSQLRNHIGLLRAGTRVTLNIIRDGKRLTLRSRVSDAPTRQANAVTRLAGAGLKNESRGRGVRITDIEPGTPAALAGLRENDLIIGVNRLRVENLDKLRALLASSPSGVLLNVRRGDRQLAVVLR